MTQQNGEIKDSQDNQNPDGDISIKDGDKGIQEELVSYNGIMLPKSVVDSINKRVASETHTWKERARTNEEKLNSLSVQMEEMRLAQMSEKERKEHEEAKKAKEIESLKEEKEKGFQLFKNYKTDTELFNEISNYDVFNPKQVVKLLKSEYQMDFIKDEAGDYNITFKIGDSHVTAKEAVKTFLNDETNSNLLRSTLKPGSGTKTKLNQTNQTKLEFKRSEIAKTNSDEAKAYREALRAGLSPKLIDG